MRGRARYGVILCTVVVTALLAWAFLSGWGPICPHNITFGSIPYLFREGDIDCYIAVKPEVEEVPLRFGEPMRVRVFITYYARPPAPEEVKVLIGPQYITADYGVTYVERLPDGTEVSRRPLMGSEVVGMGYVRYEPSELTIRANETAVMWVIIEFPEDAKAQIEEFKSGGVEKLPIPISAFKVVDETELREKYGLGISYEGHIWVIIDSEA
ncbi:MAG TPA: hypothetical protein ENF98_00240 [Candidatus Bathyarchaeota archaeon]|nr:hypothetical protein [Candidatus Bathyarchaeota archaeon]